MFSLLSLLSESLKISTNLWIYRWLVLSVACDLIGLRSGYFYLIKLVSLIISLFNTIVFDVIIFEFIA